MSMNSTMKHSFTLVLAGFHELSEGVEDALFEAGCDDGLLGVRCGAAFIDFDRASPSFPDAVVSALKDVMSAGVEVGVVRVEPDDLVNASEIARRADRTRESVRLLANGSRGPGGFPAPVANLRGSSPIWSWAEAAGWFLHHGIDGVDNADRGEAEFVARLNAALARGFSGPWTLTAMRAEFRLLQD